MRKHIPKVSIFESNRSCPFKADPDRVIDYRDPETLKYFKTDRGKILPGRITGVSAKHRRKLKKEIKRSRHLALMPFSTSSLAE